MAAIEAAGAGDVAGVDTAAALLSSQDTSSQSFTRRTMSSGQTLEKITLVIAINSTIGEFQLRGKQRTCDR